MRMRTQYYKLKKHIYFVEIFIVGIIVGICWLHGLAVERRLERLRFGAAVAIIPIF